MYYKILQSIAMYHNVLKSITMYYKALRCTTEYYQSTTECYSVLQSITTTDEDRKNWGDSRRMNGLVVWTRVFLSSRGCQDHSKKTGKSETLKGQLKRNRK